MVIIQANGPALAGVLERVQVFWDHSGLLPSICPAPPPKGAGKEASLFKDTSVS